ncbi:multidrug ABC transporter ATP-binding protein [Bacillus sp. FJAT-27916]|uniref:ABC transporter ATP-binding protein n=1 Tax=Bacillus sp. FJAT-27916 TaxID=1679169 RepID=UPI00067088AF|nr:ABC transporter transmembrane domain-containing protein [Bacillus sp. FJAT-27916]KMY44587.1 multidrug ABC transporter ATP-binding protein [Bacillus sp. FJAT-27916]
MEASKALTGKEQKKVLYRLLSYAKPHKKEISIAFLLLFLATAADITGPVLVKIFIDDYLTAGEIAVSPVIWLAGMYLFLIVAKVIIQYFQLFSFHKIALAIIQQIRVDVFSKVHQLGMRYFDRTPAGAIVSRITNDTEAIKEMFVGVISSFISSGFFIIGTIIAMFILDVTLALFCLLILPILYGLMRLYRKLSSRFYQDLRERLSQLNANLNESLQGMSIIQVFRQEKRLRAEFEDINEKHYMAGMRNIKIDGLLLRPAIDLVYTFALILILSYFGVSSMNSPIEIGVLYAFVNYIDRFFEPVNDVMQRLSIYQQAIVSGSRVFAVMDEEETAPHPELERNASIKEGRIEFRDVSFSYDGKQDVLKHISFEAKAGETVALVGHTGSGKSSIINLLMRFYEFDRGDILIDGTSIKQYPMRELREKMGLVLQDAFLFYGTVNDNVRLHSSRISDEEIVKAAKFVQADTFIEKLPNTYEDPVVERGSTFSSGQRQLIGFARTIVRNPKILVLDEATANIDTETEEAIQAGLAKMREGRTTIAIAHRLSTIQDAALILVLHKGEIVERGTHQELLAQKGLYYKMYLLQNGLGEEIAHEVS